MSVYLSVSINDVDMFRTYRMALKDRHYAQPPEPKTFFQDVPGADSSLDLSTATAGRVVYNRRTMTLNFGCGYEINVWPRIYSEILQKFHGKEGKLIFDDDPMYYYIGRMSISDYSRINRLGTFTMTVNADPYKYELTAGDEDWLWDPLDLENGIIREYKDLQVSGSMTLLIDGTEKWVIPEITVSADMKVSFEGKDYDLKQGVNKIYSIVIKPGENTLTFTGNGTVSVAYRGAIL